MAAGDGITLLQRAAGSLSVADINRLYASEGHGADTAMLRRATDLEALPEGWRAYFYERLVQRGAAIE